MIWVFPRGDPTVYQITWVTCAISEAYGAMVSTYGPYNSGGFATRVYVIDYYSSVLVGLSVVNTTLY
jgi:hypothetical protein